MTSSPDLIQELRATRQAAPADLRARVREIAAREAAVAPSAFERLRNRLPERRLVLVALPAAATLALATAGVVGLARSDAPTAEVYSGQVETLDKAVPESAPGAALPPVTTTLGAGDANRSQATPAPTDDRAQRTSATLTVEVLDSDGVSSAAQKALDLTRRLGGHVVSASVVTGEGANAAITVRVPSARVQEAIVQLSALGDIVSQQVSIEDLQATLDQLERRERSVRAQIATLVARLESEDLDAETRARLETRVQNLRAELRGLRRGIAGTNAEARMSTIQLTVVTPEFSGGVTPESRLDRTLDEALNVLVWEGVIALAILIVAAPFALVAVALWLSRRFYRRREEDRLLAT
jgi:ABC-type phosphate transport system auxiliary subunit